MRETDKTGWVILKQPNCLYCVKALDILMKAGASVRMLDVSTNRALKDFMEFQGLKTVPQIYHQGYRVGGSDVLEDYLQNLAFFAALDALPDLPDEEVFE